MWNSGPSPESPHVWAKIGRDLRMFVPSHKVESSKTEDGWESARAKSECRPHRWRRGFADVLRAKDYFGSLAQPENAW